MQEENKSNWTVVERITFRTLNTHGKAYFRTVNVLKIYNFANGNDDFVDTIFPQESTLLKLLFQ